ncbi:restriction endonuclease subunit S [Rhodococcus hoagii]|uniref:restriction endonuclease subunit S n=1 Tax=Rhodococcus hoagii TaxID=43767 RepID=UPI0011A9CA1F|nr:restriction endonuclease subunit S [Prescottella equi]NKS37671.1 restriction endonuclease subunit S [Prescottella equi]
MTATTIGAVATIFDGPHATPTRTDEGPYFLNISSLSNGRLDLELSDHVSEDDFEKWTKRVTPVAGDLLFSYETRLGEAALLPEGVRACLGRRMGLLRFDRDRVDPAFFLYYYLSPRFQNLIESRTIHGATVNRIALSTMADWEIDLPPLSLQRAIAEVLGALDDKIAANRKLADTAESLLATEFQTLGLDEETDEGSSCALTDYIDLNPQCPRVTSPEPVYVDMQKLPTSAMLIDEWDTRPAKGGARFMNGDTLLARITPCLQNRKTGYVDFLGDGEVAIGSTEYIVMRSKPGVPAELSYYLATSERFRTYAIRHMVGTSGRQRLSANDLTGYSVRVVDSESLNRWGSIASPLVEQLGVARDESRTLAATRDALLPRLMSGELRVRDAEREVEEVL